jgi:phage terminase large subunit GpA-like protein
VTPVTPTPTAPIGFLDVFRQAVTPKRELTVSEWADEHRMLGTRSSPEPGRWRTSRTPYLRDIMDALSPDSPWETIVFMKGSQIGATEAGNNWIGYSIHLAPGPFLAVQPTNEMAKRNSKQRIGPLIEDCDVLRKLVSNPMERRLGSNNVMAKEFPGGILVLCGSNSSAQLRSMAARYLFLDEVDGYPGDVEGEGEPCDLAITRTVNFPRRKIFIASTPVVSGQSRIERFFGASDQCLFYVPCPSCGVMQPLRFEQLRWPKGKPELAVYVCEACEAEIQDSAKAQMLPDGEWVPQSPGDGKTRGYHLSSLYSPTGWLSWPQVAAKYEAAYGHPDKLQVFYNTILGQPWSETGEAPDEARLYERRENYQIGKVPYGGLLLTAGVDVQIRRIEVEIVAWGRRKQSWSVDYRTFEGDTQQPQVWQNVTALLDEEFPSDYGGRMRISKLAVDSGFATNAVYGWAKKIPSSRVIVIKGNTHTPALVGAPSLLEVGPHGHRLKGGLRLWPVNSSIAKEELYRWLRTNVPNLEAGEDWPVGFCHFPQYSLEYFEQLTAEHLIVRQYGTTRKPVWEKRRERNEALDCRIYARAAAAALRFEVWSDQKWSEIESSLTTAETPESDTPVRPRAVAAARPVTPIPAFQSFAAKESFLD